MLTLISIPLISLHLSHMIIQTPSPPLIFRYSHPLILINGLKLSTISTKLAKNGDFSCDIMWEYCEKVREVTKVLLGGISQGLGLEECYLEKTLEMKPGFQFFFANYYPCCPQPELALGMPPHSDHGLLTLIIQNQVGGLQVQHQGKWIHVNALPNSLLVNIDDHLELVKLSG
uniref:Leucoanthocyanidin dioxygenase n=2 Tax=Solanum tuberosum TaxID=4113 RepID=M1CHI5_SOLTU